ncbi:nicotinate-nucleotide adenylyltransferase [bacterium]|nr:nicotinate-nucleotide adenylyltransferase [bacterium]
MRTGVMGGTFDPIHMGHLLLAETVRDECGLDCVLFVPASIPPHKTDDPVSDPAHRLAMTALAVEGSDGLCVSDCEVRRGGVSYTVDTLRALSDLSDTKGDEFHLILGMDNLLDLHAWRDPDALFRLAAVIVMDRPGVPEEKADPRFLSRIRRVRTPLIQISSTEIRARVKNGKSIQFWVHPAVERYILRNGLYR